MSFLVKILFFYILYRVIKSWLRLLIPKESHSPGNNQNVAAQNTSGHRTDDIIEAEFRELSSEEELK